MPNIFALFFRMRFFITLMISVIALTVSFFVNRPDFKWISLLCLLEMTINQSYLLTRFWKAPPERQTVFHLAGDALLFTGLVHFFGGIMSGLMGAYYLFIILFATSALKPRIAINLVFLCFFCFLGLFLLEEFKILETRNILPIQLPLNLKVLTLLIATALFLGTGLVGASFSRLFRHQAKQLSESEALYRNLFEGSSDGIFIMDLEGKVLDNNLALLNFTGNTLEQGRGHNFAEFLSEESIDDAAAMYQNVLQGEPVKARDLTITLANGQRRVLEISAAPIMIHGKMTGIMGIGRDVTERKRIESRLATYSEELEKRTVERTRELLEAKTRYQGLFENAAVPLAWLNREGNFLSVNKEMATLAGLSADRLGERRLMDLLTLSEDQVRVSDTLAGLCAAEDSAGPLQVSLRQPNGEIRTVDLYIHLDPNHSNILLSSIDITRRREIEQEQRSLHGQLIQAEKMALVGQLATGVAHEVNNPLTAISYYAQTLSRACALGEVPPDAKDKLRKIEDGAERIQQLLAKLLAYARPQEEVRREVNINLMVEQALDFVGHKLERHRGLQVKKELCPGLASIPADPSQIHQVLVNLLLNAIEAIGENPGEIRLSTRPSATGIELVCEDKGEGINHRDLPHIFTPFFTTKSSGHGTGLGLAIVKRIVEDHGGQIRVESQRGRGTTFIVSFPRQGP